MTLHLRNATPQPATVDLEARTVEAIASTFAAVVRPGFVERLDPAGMDPARLVGAPVLDGHRRESSRDQLGIVESAELRPGGLWVRLRFRSNEAARAVLADIADGTLRGLSVGYTVQSWRETREGRQMVRTATAWAPLEVSVVPIPADPGAHFRAATGGAEMPEETITAPAPAPAETEVQTRAAVNAEIRTIAETAGLGRAWADGQIDAQATAEEARAAAFAEMQTRRSAPTTRTARAEITLDHTDPAVIVRREAEALHARHNPQQTPSAEARPYMYRSTRDIAADCMRRSGQSVAGLSENELVTRALHTTSDFPAILGETMQRELRAGYNAPTGGVRQLARQSSSRYLLRNKEVLRLGELDTLKRVNEHGEFRSGTLAEAVERYMVETFGRIVSLSRQFIVNDDLGAQVQVMGRLGRAARAFEHEQLVAKLEANPLMSDGVAVFDEAGRANTITAIGDDLPKIKSDLRAARLLMRRQTALGGAMIDVAPRFVLVPPELETTAQEALSAVQATSTAEVNVFSHLDLVVEPRLTSASRWYVVADPALVDGLEYAYLEGAPGPQMETRVGFEVDGVQFRIRLDFGCGWTDYRGWVRVDT